MTSFEESFPSLKGQVLKKYNPAQRRYRRIGAFGEKHSQIQVVVDSQLPKDTMELGYLPVEEISGDSILIEDVQMFCLDKARVREAIEAVINHGVDRELRIERYLIKVLGLEED